MKKGTRALLLVLVLLALSTLACATPNADRGVPLEATGKVYGFWNGVGDSFSAPWAFMSNVIWGTNHGIYQTHNNGNWYDFGYVFGIGLIFLPIRIAVAFLNLLIELAKRS